MLPYSNDFTYKWLKYFRGKKQKILNFKIRMEMFVLYWPYMQYIIDQEETKQFRQYSSVRQ